MKIPAAAPIIVLAVTALVPAATIQIAPEDSHSSNLQVAAMSSVLARHPAGCGALNWRLARPPDTGNASVDGAFVVARTFHGEMLVNYFNADSAKPLLYYDNEGRMQQIAIVWPNGYLHLPDMGADSSVWQVR